MVLPQEFLPSGMPKGESSRGEVVDPLWNQIWRLHGPPVVRQFC
jgi:hypothetical protein